VEHLAPLLRNALGERFQPDELFRRGRSAFGDFVGLVSSVPRDFARLLREARRGKTRVDLDLKRLDNFGLQVDRTLNRVTIGILTASLVIGSAIVMTVDGGPSIGGVRLLAVLGLAGYVAAFVNSLWILYGIWRSGRD
jgi:ubiquinone biosynthesis protein